MWYHFLYRSAERFGSWFSRLISGGYCFIILEYCFDISFLFRSMFSILSDPSFLLFRRTKETQTLPVRFDMVEFRHVLQVTSVVYLSTEWRRRRRFLDLSRLPEDGVVEEKIRERLETNHQEVGQLGSSIIAISPTSKSWASITLSVAYLRSCKLSGLHYYQLLLESGLGSKITKI